MLCPNCQLQNPDTAHFCHRCGQSLVQPPIAQSGDQPASSGSLVGRVIDGKYRIESLLAEGGIGSIYRARRLAIGDEVAVKTLQPDWASDAEMLERFRREAQTAARLKHPNVVTIHDFGRTADGQVYLVMELVEGRNLRELMRRREPLAADFIAEVLEQISAALDEAHRYGIVHRDLKPENIVLAESPTDWRVKVLDFGIAHWRNLAAGVTTLTQSGVVLGTPRYMSPEQCLGQEVDGRSDVYTLGVMLFEMLTGVPPFNSSTFDALIAQHINQKPPSLRMLNPDISPAIEQVVMQALSKQRDERQSSAGALSRQLAAALQPSAPLATPPPPTPSPMATTNRTRSPGARIMFDANRTDRTGRAVSKTGEGPHKGCARDLFILVLLTLICAGVFTWWKFSEEKPPSINIAVVSPSMEVSDESLRLTRKVPPADALARAEALYREGRYDEAAIFGKAVLAKSPDQSRAEALLGQSYFMLGQDETVSHLNRALALGATVTLPIKHHHLGGILKLKEGFCPGELLLQKGAIEFHSYSESNHSFRIAPQALIELRDESRLAGRIHTRIAIDRGGATQAQNYNFYPALTGRRGNRLRVTAACNSPLCLHQAEAVYQLLRQLKP
ncbi:MAG: protein kinase [Acidobacteriota bacterium]|nr:protein kinase [Acidobacteriota bacterium]